MRVLEDPFLYLNNWDALNLKMQVATAGAFFDEAQDIRTRLNSSGVICVVPAVPVQVGSSSESCISVEASAESDWQLLQE